MASHHNGGLLFQRMILANNRSVGGVFPQVSTENLMKHRKFHREVLCIKLLTGVPCLYKNLVANYISTFTTQEIPPREEELTLTGGQGGRQAAINDKKVMHFYG